MSPGVLKICRHLVELPENNLPKLPLSDQTKCEECGKTDENWLCLSCNRVCCGRYVQAHMVDHHTATLHPMAIRFKDGLVWCYPCHSYVDNSVLNPIKNMFKQIKKQRELKFVKEEVVHDFQNQIKLEYLNLSPNSFRQHKKSVLNNLFEIKREKFALNAKT